MKKITAVCVTLIIILTGCLNSKKSIEDTAKQAFKDASIESTTSNQNQPDQTENSSNNIKDINSNKYSALLESLDPTKAKFDKGYHDYKGTINNNIAIQMSIYPLEREIVGTYFYEKQKKEIKLQGKAGEKNIILFEYDEAGKNTGIFEGSMDTVDKIEGTWKSADGKSVYPFTLALKSIIFSAEYGKRYALAIKNISDQEVEDFASKVQSYVANNNKEQLAAQIRYPINVKINGKATKIQNKDEFINKYDEIMHPEYKKLIINAFTKYLFTNWQGVMLGNGEMWFNEVADAGNNSKLMITSINN